MQLPSELQRWADVLLFTTTVDSEGIWRPQRSLCARVAPGESWTGRGSERVYASCGPPRNTYCDPYFVLPEGPHKVTMTAWWPGLDATMSASAPVELSCAEPSR